MEEPADKSEGVVRKSSLPTSFGPYHVVSLIGRGGFGEAYLVSRTFEGGLTKHFCLKRIHPDYAADRTRNAEFVDEARVLTMLDAHPGIVHLVDFFQDKQANVAALVMEYVDGLNLGELQKSHRNQGRRLPPSVSVYIAAEICSALAYAHALREEVVHRDISPNNIFLGFDGHVKLGDFGIATFIGRTQYTATTEMKGLARYMSPEHIDPSMGMGPQSDIFSLGSVLYEMLTDRLPFPGIPIAAIRSITRGDFVPLPEILPDIEPQLATLVHEMLAPDKTHRPGSAGEVRRRLIAALPRADARDALSAFVKSCRRENAAEASSYTANAPDVAAALEALGSLQKARTASTAAPTVAKNRAVTELIEISEAKPVRTVNRRFVAMTAAGLLSLGGALGLFQYTGSPAQSAPAVDTSPVPPLPSATERSADAASREPSFVQTPSADIAAAPTADTEEHRSEPAEDAGVEHDYAVPRRSTKDTPTPSAEHRRAANDPKPAIFTVEVYNFGYVSIDDSPPVKAPLKRIKLNPGRHSIRVYEDEWGHHELKRTEVNLAAGETSKIELHVTDK